MSKLGVSSEGNGRPRNNILSTSFFSNATRVLGMIKDVCDAFSGVPYVKAVAGLVQHIIEISDQVKAYKDKCQALVNKVVLFSRGIFEGLLSLSRTPHPGEQIQSLKSDLLAFLGVLEGIYITLDKLTAQRVSSRFLRYIARAELLDAIAEQEKNLETYIQYFNTRSNIAIRLGLCAGSDTVRLPLFVLNATPQYPIKRPIPIPPPLYGRDHEVVTIVDLLTVSNTQAHLAILGPGGIGKTSLSLTILANKEIVSMFNEDRFFLSCDSNPSLDLLIYELATTLDVTGDGLSSQLLQFIFFRLRQRPCLLVFDNLETLWDPLHTRSAIESFLSEISSIPTVNLLITLRGSQHPAGVEWSRLLPPLKPLELRSARALFSKISRKPDDSCVVDLIKAIDCVPLAVTLLAHLAAVHDVTPESLWERWIEEKTMMIERGEDRLANLDTSIRLSLNSPRMKHDPNALPFLSIIALLPGGMSHDTFRACDAHLPEIINIKRAVNTLRQNTLIYEDPSRTLRILSPIRHYILAHHPATELTNAFIEEYFVQLAFLGGDHVASVHSRLRHEIGNIEEMLVRALRSLRPAEEAVTAILALAEYTYVTGVGSCIPLERAVDHIAKIVDSKPKTQKSTRKSFRRLFLGRAAKDDSPNENDKGGSDLLILQADCLGCLGQLLSRQGHYDQAKEKFDLALELHTQRGDLVGQAADLHNLGCLLTLDEASEKFASASKLHEVAGDRTGMAYDMMGLGQVYLQRYQLPRAQEIFASALRIFDEMGGDDEDPTGRITALNNLGHTLTSWNKFGEAETCFNQAIQQNESIGDVVGKANSLCGLASTFLLRSRWKEAEAKIREAMQLREPFKDPDHFHLLGRIKCAQWKLTEAVETFEYTLTLSRGPKSESGRGDDLKYLAYTFALLGRVDEAQPMLEEVKALYQVAENVVGLAELAISQAEIWTVQQRLEEAEAAARDAADVMKSLGCQIGQAHALYVLGGVELAKGAYSRARENVRLALELHENIGSIQGQADDLACLTEILLTENEAKDNVASRIINAAMALHEEVGDVSGVGDDWYLRSLLGMRRDDLAVAEGAVRKALEMHRAAEVLFKQGRDYSLLARILKLQGRREEGTEAIGLAIGIFQRVGAGKEVWVCQEFRGEMVT
ncbi:TPR-like protein [Macrolepiota fuliginosa MF-IS2]|uniref:TPR-like protein n=1 Tax=Macrolepiota fuliginosa MF-IS2 TaxID=1400762 RepID=A0A9P5X685_9AGAR|nr:TPR-like protein [Macrolepiota fuliginosa MF-IS2]